MGVSNRLLSRIRRAIGEDLSRKGLEELPVRQVSRSDLFLTFHLSIEQRLEVNDPYYSYDRVRTYEKGTLVIDVIDTKKNKVIWTGSGKTRIRYYSNPEQRQSRIDEVVHSILSQYPPAL